MKALLVAVLIALLPAAALARPGLDAAIGPDGVTITDNELPVLFYRTKPADPAVEPGRLNYVHPLYAPDGTILTEDRPADHLHQRGVFWSWHQIRLGGDQVADGWFMKGLTFFVKQTNFDGERGGAGVLTLHVDWIINSGPELVFVAKEVTKVRIQPLKNGTRRIDFDTTITPLVDGLSMGGSDDAKGYGGFSMRLVASDRLVFASAGKVVKPAVTPVTAGSSMGFTWPDQPGLSKWAVGLACKVNGRPVSLWILRRETSMQNCVWPGRTPAALPKDKPLRLQSTLVIRPAAGK
ncbi:MAG: PmoA family protein [Caulobacter sp.]|nr:PmoA family protein [Caulobacter sp.]